jgi:hypothetical protein
MLAPPRHAHTLLDGGFVDAPQHCAALIISDELPLHAERMCGVGAVTASWMGTQQ